MTEATGNILVFIGILTIVCCLQVSNVLNASTSAHNLALMYEGWTPWV